MSFASDVKEELARVAPECSHCGRAVLAALVRVEGTLLLRGPGRYGLESLVRMNVSQKLEDGFAAFQVDHVRAAPLHDARMNAGTVHERRQILGKLARFERDLEVEIAARIGDEAASHEP